MYGPAGSRPECALLMDEVMEQVAVLADQPGAAGSRRTSRRGPRATGSASNRASARPAFRDGRRHRRRGRRSSGEPRGLGSAIAGGGRARGLGRRTQGRTRPFRSRPSHRSSRRQRRSARSRPGGAAQPRRQRSKSRPPLRTGTTTESDGLRSTGLAGPAGTSSMIYPRPSDGSTCRNASPSVGSPEHAPATYGDGTGR